MIRGRTNGLVAAGMAAMVIGLVMHQWTGGNYWHFTGGFLLGLAVVLLIGSFWKFCRSPR